jgi:hypothetical protein
MDEKLFENFVFVGIPREASEVSGIGPGTVVRCTADDGVLVLVKEQKEPEREGLCICPECMAQILTESENGYE